MHDGMQPCHCWVKKAMIRNGGRLIGHCICRVAILEKFPECMWLGQPWSNTLGMGIHSGAPKDGGLGSDGPGGVSVAAVLGRLRN